VYRIAIQCGQINPSLVEVNQRINLFIKKVGCCFVAYRVAAEIPAKNYEARRVFCVKKFNSRPNLASPLS